MEMQSGRIKMIEILFYVWFQHFLYICIEFNISIFGRKEDFPIKSKH